MSSDTRERILAEATELYLRDGINGFSMRALARAVGVTAPALYRHYTSKENVLQEVIAEAYRRFAETLYGALSEPTPYRRFRAAIEGYVDFALENPRLYEVIFVPPTVWGEGVLPEEIEAQACAVENFFEDRVRECVATGVLRDDRVGPTLWAHTHGMLTLYRRGHLEDHGIADAESCREMIRASTTRIMEGLGGEAVRSGQQALDPDDDSDAAA